VTIDVLLALPDLGSGGPDGVFVRLLKGFDRHRVRPSLVVHRATGTRIREVPPDVAIHELDTDARYPVVALARLVRATRPDVVLSTLRMNQTALVAKAAFPKHVKLVIREANNVSMANAELAQQSALKAAVLRVATPPLLRRTDAVIAQSSPMVDDLRTLLDRPRRRARIEHVPNLIDVDELRARAGAGALPAKPGNPTLVTVGRLFHQKGYDILLPAFRAIRDDHASAHLWIIGEGPERSALEHQIVELGLSGAVDLLGFQANPFPLVAAADLFVSSSRYEGLPNAVLEAQALGVPVVGTDGPGASQDLVEVGATGWLAAPGSVPSLVAALRTALATGPGLGGAAIAERTRSRFSVTAICRRYENLLLSVAGADLAV